MFLLDTNVISELRKAKSGKADSNVVAWANSVSAARLYISVITILVLRSWLNTHVLPAFSDRILAVDTAVAQRCARLHVPDPRSDRDALIAATALVHGITVVTRNTEDFVQTGTVLLNPWNQ
jgi:toxin FitB